MWMLPKATRRMPLPPLPPSLFLLCRLTSTLPPTMMALRCRPSGVVGTGRHVQRVAKFFMPLPPPLVRLAFPRTAPRRLPPPPPTVVWTLIRTLRRPPLLLMRTARRQRSDVGNAVVTWHESRRGTVSGWQRSELIEAIPRDQTPVPSRDGQRRIRLSGDVVDQSVSQILRRRLV